MPSPWLFGAPLTVINTINTLYNLQIYVGHALSTQKLDVQRRKTKAMRCLSPVGQCLAGLPKWHGGTRESRCSMLGRQGGLPESQGCLDELQDVHHWVRWDVGNCFIQKCVFRCGGKPMFIIVHRFLLILILWICSRCSSSCASSQLPFFSKIYVENNPYKGSRRFFVLNCVTFQRTRWYLHRPCWDELCLWQKPCSAQRLPSPFQSQGFHECTKRISHQRVRNVQNGPEMINHQNGKGRMYVGRHDDVW